MQPMVLAKSFTTEPISLRGIFCSDPTDNFIEANSKTKAINVIIFIQVL